MHLPDGGKHRAPVTQPVSAPEYHGNDGDYRAPTTLVEQILAGICAGVLGVDRVGVDESFFHLGGDSLSAMRAVAAINTALDTNLAVTTIFDAPSVRSLSEQLDRHASPAEELPTVSPASEL
jgi:acyl carrier protein